MPLPFILGGLALAVAGYGVKKGIDAKGANDKTKDLLKKAEERLEKTIKKRAESAESGCGVWLQECFCKVWREKTPCFKP